MSRIKYFFNRLLVTIILIFAIASGLFLLFRLMPGDFLDYVAGTGAASGELESLRAKWGLNEPLYVQYYRYIFNLLQGDVGTSFRFGQPVWEVVKPRLINTFILAAPAITTAYLLGSFFGGWMGFNRNTLKEKWGVIGVTTFGTIPDFFTGILLLIIFSFWFGIFPTSGMLSLETTAQLADRPFYYRFATTDFWMHYILPFSTIVIRYLYYPSLIMRTSVVEVSQQDFMYYHRVKGLAPNVQLRHLMKHASLPVITAFPVSMVRALGGMVLVEIVFNWPGIGKLLVDSVLFRDYPVVQFVFFLAAIWVVLGNFIVDIIYGVIDPRIVVEGEDTA